MISIELELSEIGYSRLCRIAERMAIAGAANPDLASVLQIAIESGTQALEMTLDQAERERRGGRLNG